MPEQTSNFTILAGFLKSYARKGIFPQQLVKQGKLAINQARDEKLERKFKRSVNNLLKVV